MKFHSLRKSFIGGAIALATVVLLGSCGGGGATQDPLQGGTLSFLPQQPTGTTYYGGVPVNLAIAGGRRPYALFSSDPGILPVPNTLNGSNFTVVPNNPGVVDTGLAPEDLPRRTVRLTARDSIGLQTFMDVQVAQNFLTGYGLTFTSNCPSAGAGGAAGTGPGVCSGGESAVRFAAVFNGSRAGNRVFRLDILRGPALFVFPGTNNTGASITTNSDHSGIVTAIMRVAANVPTQLGVIRVTDVATGVYTDTVFPISQSSPTTNLTAIPNEIKFTGALSTECGTGVAEFLVFDGAAPFTVISSSPDIQVRRLGGANDQPGRFEIRANNPGVCLTDASVIVVDANGARTTVAVTTERGTVDPPAPPEFAVAPTALDVFCGTSGSVTVVGGSGVYRVASSHPRVSAIASSNTVTISRLSGDGGVAYPTTATISVTDGTSVESVVATVPATCP